MKTKTEPDMQRAFFRTLTIASITTLLTACAGMGASSAHGPRPACPTAQQMEQPELLGRWSVQMDGEPGPITIDLGPHPEWDGTVKGSITRPGFQSIVVGDVNKGELTMEESRDGKSVSGNWYGTVPKAAARASFVANGRAAMTAASSSPCASPHSSNFDDKTRCQTRPGLVPASNPPHDHHVSPYPPRFRLCSRHAVWCPALVRAGAIRRLVA